MLHLIAKPLKGKKAKLLAQIEDRLKAENVPYELHLTTRAKEAKEFAARYSEEGNVLVVVGGDGMLNEVLSGMDPKKAALGLIPAGTGNDFAAAAKIPKGIEALGLILGGTPKPTDYIEFGAVRSLNAAGIGIDADVLARCERMKHLHARSKYFLSLLASLCKYRGCRMKLRTQGEEHEGRYLLAVICNGSQFGGGIPICPPAKIDDGKLELVYVDCPAGWKIPHALIKLLRGKVLSLPFAHRQSVEEAEFLPETPQTAQFDGELYEFPALHARLMRDLNMYRG